jgi:hypothetical protein
VVVVVVVVAVAVGVSGGTGSDGIVRGYYQQTGKEMEADGLER